MSRRGPLGHWIDEHEGDTCQPCYEAQRDEGVALHVALDLRLAWARMDAQRLGLRGLVYAIDEARALLDQAWALLDEERAE